MKKWNNILWASVLALTFTTQTFANYVNPPLGTNKGGTGTVTQTASKAVTTDGSGNVVSTSATTATEIGYVSGVTSALQTQLNGKASTALGNLASVAINASLLPASSGAIHLGSTAKLWGNGYLTLLKDASDVISVDPLGRLLKSSSGATILDYSSGSAKVSDLEINGSTSGSIQIKAADTTTSYTVKMPAVQCSSGQVMQNDGSGNLSCLTPATKIWTVVDGGNAAYTILTADQHVRTTTTLTADRAYTLPVCNASNIGEKHEVKNLPAQTKNIILTAAGSDNIDGNATFTLLPGDSAEVICGAFSSAGTWDIE